MSDARLDAMRSLAEKMPNDPRTRLFLAHELFKAQAWEESARHYEAYLGLASGDVGAAWKNLGECCARLGDADRAAEAFRKGIAAALVHHHEGLAAEIEDLLEDLA
jgi:tetratricopeptide (TPR) repeat protein